MKIPKPDLREMPELKGRTPPLSSLPPPRATLPCLAWTAALCLRLGGQRKPCRGAIVRADEVKPVTHAPAARAKSARPPEHAGVSTWRQSVENPARRLSGECRRDAGALHDRILLVLMWFGRDLEKLAVLIQGVINLLHTQTGTKRRA